MGLETKISNDGKLLSFEGSGIVERWNGKVTQIGSAEIKYDDYNRIVKVGDTTVSYWEGKVYKVEKGQDGSKVEVKLD